MSTATLEMPPAVNDSAAPTKDLQKVFQEKFVQIDLDKRRPELAVKLTQDRLKKHGVEVHTQVDGSLLTQDAEEYTHNGINLLTKPQREIISRAYRKVIDFVEDPAMTRPSKIRGLRILPMSLKDNFFGNWPVIEERFYTDLEAFFEIYETDVRRRNRERWSPQLGESLWKEIERRHLPPLDRLRDKFSVKVITGHFNYDDLKDAEAALEDLAKSVRAQLKEALGSLAAKLKSGKKLTAATLNELRSALAAVRAFSDVGDKKMLAEATSLEKTIDKIAAAAESAKFTGDTMTSIVKGHAQTLTTAIESMTRVVQDHRGVDEAMARFGAAPRLIGKKL